ncbi:DUF1080 domain-containing protein [bacterium]|nr:DUF1080 domain-containing protein [bacterium]
MRYRSLCIGLLITGSAAQLTAQIGTGMEQQVRTLVSRWPAEDGTRMQAQADSLIGLGPEAIAILCRILPGTGEGGDPAPQYALHGVVHTVSLPGREKERRLVTDALLTCLASDCSVPVKAFILRQLRLCATERVIRGVRPFLTHPLLCDPASQVLATLGGPSAMDALIAALNRSGADCTVTLIRALGGFHDPDIFKPLAPFASSSDTDVREAALDALAATGYPPAYDLLKKIPVTASRSELTDAVFRLLTFAERAVDQGYSPLAETICRDILAAGSDDASPQCAALSLLVRIGGPSVQSDLLAAADSPHRDLQAAALNHAERLAGSAVTARWIEKMGSADPSLQVRIITMLGRRGDRTALPLLIQSVQSADAGVRLAAATAGARLAGDDFLPELLHLFKHADSSQAAYLKTLILSAFSPEAFSELASALPLLPPPSQVAVIQALGVRRLYEETAAVYAGTASDVPEVRLAAMRALSRLADTGYSERIISLLRYNESPDEIAALQEALVMSSGGSSNGILAAVASMSEDERINFLPVLARLGDEACLAAVTRDARSGNLPLRRAAVRALAAWPSPAALPVLSAIAYGNSGTEEKEAAVDGFLRIASADPGEPETLFSRLAAIAPCCTTEARKKILLKTFAEVHSSAALDLVGSYLEDPVVAAEAAVAAARIVSTDAFPVTDTVTAVMLRALYRCRDPYVHEQIAAFLEAHAPSRLAYRPLFNGEDLSGWKRHEHLPGHGLAGRWFVEEGVIVGMQDPPGQGGFLVTEEAFRDFDLRMEVKIDWPFDSGVFLRVGPDGKSHQVTLDYREGGEIGGIYLPWVRGFVHHNSDAASLFARAEWNSLRIVCLGEPALIRVWLNGQLITDFQHTPESTAGVPAEGGIALQVHPGGEGFENSRAMFWNITIREIR